MEFKHLRTFVEVVRTGSFTDAAQNLFLSQPTVSQHIRQIEEELGCRLVMRTTRRIEITPQGRELASYAEDILALRDKMYANCSRKGHSILSIGASTIPSAYILPAILKQFGKEHPEVYFSIQQSDSAGTEKGVMEGLFDLGLTGRPCTNEELEAEPFCSDEMVLITPVSRYFLEMKEKGGDVRALLDQPIILREEGSGSLKAADRYLAAEKIDPAGLHVVARINDQEAIKNMVAGGVGISFLSSRAAAEFVEAKRVLSFPLPDGTASRQFYIIQRKGDIPSATRREFIRFLHSYSHNDEKSNP
ncbi:MAG TPA: LysR family transcriptional regulator [Lachnospiraceae bacterium]|nr:LysR family transcriptional regulator [Lachnospiraceae bacterium]